MNTRANNVNRANNSRLNTTNNLVTLKPNAKPNAAGPDTPANIVKFLFRLQLATKLFHWQTRSFAAHKASGELYDQISKLTDEIVEAYMGTYGNRVRLPGPTAITLTNMTAASMRTLLRDGIKYLMQRMPADSHIAALRDELVDAMATAMYLLTMA